MPPPTSTLKPVSPAAERTRCRPMSWKATAARSSRAPLIAILNLRGSQLNSGWMADHCRTISQNVRGSTISSGAIAGVLVRSDIAQAVAAGLDRVHLDLGEPRQDVGGFFQPDPVELNVLACREMAIAAIVLTRDCGERAQLPRRQQPVGNRNPQHRRVPLQIKAIAQTQRPKLVFGELAAEETPHLVAIFGDAFEDQRAIDRVVAIHRRANVEARGPSASNDCCCRYIARRWSYR